MNSLYPHPSRSDTGLWHLTVYLSGRRVRAWLDLKENPGLPSRILMNEGLPEDGRPLLEKIENCVYDHPEVLDDYSATVIVESPRCLLIPSRILVQGESAEEMYGKVYGPDAGDVMIDTNSAPETVLFSLTRGLKGFLSRTFSGARVCSHLGRLKQTLRPEEGEGRKVFLNLRDKELDMIAFDGRALLSASTHRIASMREATALLFSLMEIYGLEAADTEVKVAGPEEDMEELRSIIGGRTAALSEFRSPLIPAGEEETSDNEGN